MSDTGFSKGSIVFIFAFGIFALGFWLVYDLSSKGAVKAEMVSKESKLQIERLNTKIDKIKNYFKVELEKIDEAENRAASQKASKGGGGGGAASGDLANRISDLEAQVRKLNKESRRLRAMIREYEDM